MPLPPKLALALRALQPYEPDPEKVAVEVSPLLNPTTNIDRLNASLRFRVKGPLLADHQNLTGGLQPCVSLVRRTLTSPCLRFEVVETPLVDGVLFHS